LEISKPPFIEALGSYGEVGAEEGSPFPRTVTVMVAPSPSSGGAAAVIGSRSPIRAMTINDIVGLEILVQKTEFHFRSDPRAGWRRAAATMMKRDEGSSRHASPTYPPSISEKA
jgi:hypothetical protein